MIIEKCICVGLVSLAELEVASSKNSRKNNGCSSQSGSGNEVVLAIKSLSSYLFLLICVFTPMDDVRLTLVERLGNHGMSIFLSPWASHTLRICSGGASEQILNVDWKVG